MRMWFRPVKGIAFCIVAAFFAFILFDKMNKYLFCIFLFIGGGFVSCKQTNSDVELLEQVERCVEVYPDSAMQ